MFDTAYAPGELTLLAGSRALLLVQAEPTDDLPRALWRLLAADADAESLIDAVSAFGMRNLPSLGLLHWVGERVNVIARGDIVVAVEGDAGTVRIAGRQSATWADRRVEGARYVSVEFDGFTSPAMLPLIGGVVRAQAAKRGRPGELERYGVELWGAPALLEENRGGLLSDAGRVSPPAARPPAPAPPQPSDPFSMINAVPMGSQPSNPGAPVLPPTLVSSRDQEPHESPQLRADQPPYGLSTPYGLRGTEGHDAPMVAAMPSAPAGTPSVAWESSDHTETMFDPPGGARAAVSAGPSLVRAKICPTYEHPNPAHLDHCRRCGTPLGQPTMIPQPAVGVLRLSTGQEEVVDRTVVIGRHPNTPAYHDLAPHIIPLPDQTMVSASHLEVTVDGFTVLVRDVGSRNGTEVTLPGLDPKRLVPDDPPLPILAGTIIKLGGVVTVTFEEM